MTNRRAALLGVFGIGVAGAVLPGRARAQSSVTNPVNPQTLPFDEIVIDRGFEGW